MRVDPRTALIGFVMLASTAALVGCQTDRGASAQGRRSHDTGATTTLTGTLRGGQTAIGGEGTGWRLVGDGATGGFDVDVSQVRDRATELDGKRVSVRGRMTTRNWPERGPTQVLVAHSIEPAPSSAAK